VARGGFVGRVGGEEVVAGLEVAVEVDVEDGEAVGEHVLSIN
jgi:hypothetical protein